MVLTGAVLVAFGSSVGGLAGGAGLFVAARLAQGAGAALMLPAALSTLTTTFTADLDRHKAVGGWTAVAGIASAVGILLGGLLVEGPDWRWVMFVNPITCALIIPAVLRTLAADSGRPGTQTVRSGRERARHRRDAAPRVRPGEGADPGLGCHLHLVRARRGGDPDPRFAAVERSAEDPILRPQILRTPGLVAANLTGLAGFAGMLSLFFFLTLYMQTLLGYSPLAAGAACLPLTFAVGISAGIGAKLLAKVGSRAVIVGGASIAADGLALLDGVPVGGSDLSDILPGLLVVAFGLGAVFVAVTAAANASATSGQAGIVAALLNAAQQVGGALGLAILSALATAHADDLLASGARRDVSATAGYDRALLAAAAFMVLVAVIALATVIRRDPTEAGLGQSQTSLQVVR
jgi:MFS family permease